jgi:hypothetical protein
MQRDPIEPGPLVEVEAQLALQRGVNPLRQAGTLIQPVSDLEIEPADLLS